MQYRDKIQEIKKYGKQAKGKKELIRYLETGKIDLREAIWAKCYDCMGHYADGIQDCGIKHCPLYPFNPYNNG